MPAQVLLDQIKLVGPNQLHNELVSLSFSAHQILGIVPSRGEGHRLTSSLWHSSIAMDTHVAMATHV